MEHEGEHTRHERATKDFVRAEVSKVEIAVAKGFSDANNVISGIQKEIAEQFGNQGVAIAKMDRDNADRATRLHGRITTLFITGGILVAALVSLVLAIWG